MLFWNRRGFSLINIMNIQNPFLADVGNPGVGGGGDSVFGKITAPAFLGTLTATDFFGKLLDRTVKLLIIGAGIYAVVNLILAGYSFMSAGDDPKKVGAAWSMIYQTIIGLAVAAGSLVLAAIFSELLFGDPLFLLKPTIPTL
jgi:hypothetical protein